MVTITGEYQGDLHCSAVHGPSGTALSTDAPRDNQGRGEAFSPTDLLATGFATCIATTMAMAARKHGVEIGGIKFEVTKEMSPDAPRRISRLTARLRMPASARGVPQGVLEKAANTCPVHQSLAPSVEKVIELIWE
jgi:putative redox protein